MNKKDMRVLSDVLSLLKRAVRREENKAVKLFYKMTIVKLEDIVDS